MNINTTIFKNTIFGSLIVVCVWDYIFDREDAQKSRPEVSRIKLKSFQMRATLVICPLNLAKLKLGTFFRAMNPKKYCPGSLPARFWRPPASILEGLEMSRTNVWRVQTLFLECFGAAELVIH